MGGRVAVCQGLAELRSAGRRRIAGEPLPQRQHRRLLRRARRAKVWLAGTEADDLDTLSAQLHRSSGDAQSRRFLDPRSAV